MAHPENFIAVDWRSEGDKCFFFFKEFNEYYRFDNGADRVSPGYPKPVSEAHWGDFHRHLKNLRFGFATDQMTARVGEQQEVEILWLFYYDGQTPMFCEYDQKADGVRSNHKVAESMWAALLPYFERIVAGTWWKRPSANDINSKFRFLLNDGHILDLDWGNKETSLQPVNEATWPGLAPYKDRIITAVQMYSDTGDSLYYLFLTGHEYLKYNIDRQSMMNDARSVYGKERWPGLFEKPQLKNFVAVDWRAGKDCCYFFFKDSNTHTRFDIGANRVPKGYPKKTNYSNWKNFHSHVKHLRFGFTTTNFQRENLGILDQDFLWLFYEDAGQPMVCTYFQDNNRVLAISAVADSVWEPILPYFDRIVAGAWWQNALPPHLSFRFLMNDGNTIFLKWNRPSKSSGGDWTHRVTLQPINDTTWPGLEPYKDRIITAVQNDRTLADSYYYIFLTNNEYITYNIPQNRVEYGPYQVSEHTWPGLLSD